MKKANPKELFKLFYTMLYISAFTFGGGFVIVTLMQRKFVEELHWLEEDEMLDLTAIAQSCPGAIAVNASILVGFRVGGLLGALISVIGTIIPPLFIISIIQIFYNAFRSNQYVSLLLKGMQAGVAAVIFDVVFNLGKKVLDTKDIINIIVMVLAFVATVFFNVNVIMIILIAAALGVVRTLFFDKKEVAK